jgi:transcriptional regulator with XRE-family HTH domain
MRLFGGRLAELRKERGLTQEQLAKLLGMTRKMVDYYERRARNPSTEIVSKIAVTFDVPVGVLLGERAPRRRAKPGPAVGTPGTIEKIRNRTGKHEAKRHGDRVRSAQTASRGLTMCDVVSGGLHAPHASEVAAC